MLSLKVGGVWVSSFAAYGPVTVEFGLHGSEAASWEMPATVRHPVLRSNRLVEVFDGGVPIWVGTLVEPGSTGEYHARGLWHQAESIPAMAPDGSLTTIPDLAQAGASEAYRGETLFYTPVSIAPTAWAAASPGGELSLAALWDGWAAENALRWIVSPSRIIYVQADPTVPQWHVPHAVAGRGLTPAEDEFATHLAGRYLNATTNTYQTVTVGSTEAAAHFGRRTLTVDLSSMGGIDATRATSVLNGMFLRSGARMGFGEGLELGYGQITTPGGIAASLAQVQAGQLVRLAGVVDTSRANKIAAHLDVVIERSRYTDGSGSISLTPYGYAPRTLGSVFEKILQGELK